MTINFIVTDCPRVCIDCTQCKYDDKKDTYFCKVFRSEVDPDDTGCYIGFEYIDDMEEPIYRIKIADEVDV